MQYLFQYLITSAIGMAILLTVYKLMFSNQASFLVNRIILLTIIIFGFTGHFISKMLLHNYIGNTSGISLSDIPNKIFTAGLNEISVNAGTTATSLNITEIIFIIYLGGVIVTSLLFLYSIVKIIMLWFRSEKIKNNSVTIVLPKDKIQPFSFFNIIFINKDLMYSNNSSAAIIKHEKIHISQYHSIDILLVELLKIIQWFNPFVYVLKRFVVENHEYLADRGTLNVLQNISDYKVLLLSHSIQQKTSMLTNNFSYLLIKKRLKMMKKNQSKFRTLLSLAIFTIVLAGVIISCSDNTSSKSNSTNQKQVTAEPAQKAESTPPTITDSIFVVVEKMPEFPGGRKALYKYLAENIHYPEQAKKRKIQGRVFVNFVVDTDGSIKNVKILRGIGHGCDQEALRVVSSMPKWIPGEQKGRKVKVSFNLPIKFQLD